MSKYLLRLDDASDYMNIEKWQRIENLLDRYHIKPIVGVIPDNRDPDMLGVYTKDILFWDKVRRWQHKGWTIALHGYNHVFETNDGGINPVNNRSEFAGVSLERQKERIKNGCAVFHAHGIEPKIFFAPAHTFDMNTLVALKDESKIRIISDTIANNVYFENEFYFIPQQSGRVRRLPFSLVTFCYHPNLMTENDFMGLEDFLKKNRNSFCQYNKMMLKKNEFTLLDYIIRKMYFFKRTWRKKNE